MFPTWIRKRNRPRVRTVSVPSSSVCPLLPAGSRLGGGCCGWTARARPAPGATEPGPGTGAGLRPEPCAGTGAGGRSQPYAGSTASQARASSSHGMSRSWL